jgi:hypothetical protein
VAKETRQLGLQKANDPVTGVDGEVEEDQSALPPGIRRAPGLDGALPPGIQRVFGAPTGPDIDPATEQDIIVHGWKELTKPDDTVTEPAPDEPTTDTSDTQDGGDTGTTTEPTDGTDGSGTTTDTTDTTDTTNTGDTTTTTDTATTN